MFVVVLEDEEDDFRSEDEEVDSDDSLEVIYYLIKWYMYVWYKYVKREILWNFIYIEIRILIYVWRR